MSDEEIKGIHITGTKDFHYFISGMVNRSLEVDRVRKLLIGRGLIHLTDKGFTPYKIMTVAEARLAELNIVPHYANKHLAQTQPATAPRDLSEIWD